MNIEWTLHKGRKVLRIEFSRCKSPDEMMATLLELDGILKNSADKVPMLISFEGVMPDLAFLAKAREIAQERASKILKQAMLGITGAKKSLLSTYMIMTRQKNVETFETDQQALDWLTT